MEARLDDLDRRILRLFAEDPHIGVLGASRRLGVARGTVQAFSTINTISARLVDANGGQALPGKGRDRSGVCGSAIRGAGLDMVSRLAAIRERLASVQLADALQIAGTPTFIIGDTLMRGMPQTGIVPVIEQARANAMPPLDRDAMRAGLSVALDRLTDRLAGLAMPEAARLALEALRAAGDEKVKLQLKGALNPMIISPMEGDRYTYLVLPVRLKAND